MARKENQRILLTKRMLQEGLLRLLETKSLEKISVTELCREAGINRATFYNHYNSPQDLLSDLEQHMAQEVASIINAPLPCEDLVCRMEMVCTYLKEHSKTITVLIRCHADNDLADIFNNLDRHCSQLRISSKNIPLDGDSQHLVSTFLFTGSYHMIMEWLIRDIPKTPRQIAELVLSIISKEYL